MTRSENNRLMMVLLSGMFFVAIAMAASMYIATRRPIVMMMPGSGDNAGLNVAGGQTAGSNAGDTATGGSENDSLPMQEIVVKRVSSVPDTSNPLDSAWNGIPSTEILLERQATAAPMLEDQTVAALTVQAIRDDSRISWRLSWDQSSPADSSDVARFTDAVALQFPLADGAPYTMGGPGLPVMMLYWKALWQKDIDEGYQDVSTLYPNSWSDFYWFADGKKFPEDFEDAAAKQYLIGVSAGNPMSSLDRTKPMQEMQAEGFGSSTSIEDTPSDANGVWQDGRWTVVFDRPLSAGDPLVERFNANPSQQLVALGIWDGSAQNRGGRKQITNWIPMRIEP